MANKAHIRVAIARAGRRAFAPAVRRAFIQKKVKQLTIKTVKS